jgi:hypothetical protein
MLALSIPERQLRHLRAHEEFTFELEDVTEVGERIVTLNRLRGAERRAGYGRCRCGVHL